MRCSLSLISILCSFSFAIEPNFEVENINILSKDKSNIVNDYNRLRVDISFIDSNKIDYILIVDNYSNYSSDLKDNNTKIYRAYLEYSDEKQRVTVGKQRIPFGVGRVWNPIDIFNPIDATSIEIDEREGTDSFRYEYAIDTLSNLDATISENRYAFRVKEYIDSFDIALIALEDRELNRTIFGYEVEGELFNTAIEVRSEGGYFSSKESRDYRELILGAEYNFENSLGVLSEYRYNSLEKSSDLALQISYTISMLLKYNYLIITNLEDENSINLIKFNYSLSDDIDLDLGYYLYRGSENSEYKILDKNLYVKLFVYF
jgi:hypothetical protein